MPHFPTVEISYPRFMPPGVNQVTVKSPALRRRGDITFYRPTSVVEGTSLPLVILLHGVYGSHWAWLGKGGAHLTLERLIHAENLSPMLIACPSDGLFGDGSGYLKHTDADYASWIVDDVPAAAALVDPAVNPKQQFITGLSMGGYGALRLGALHPDKFLAFSGMSSATDFDTLDQFVAASGHTYHLAETNPLDVLGCMVQNRKTLRPFRFDCGVDDDLLVANRRLHGDLEAAGISHEYVEHPGGHEWDYWETHLADQLRFFARQLV